jgi:hypothetical protein
MKKETKKLYYTVYMTTGVFKEIDITRQSDKEYFIGKTSLNGERVIVKFFKKHLVALESRVD